MYSEPVNKNAYIPALAGAGICFILLRTGMFSFFFLAPLSFLAYKYNYKTAWLSSLILIIGNALLGFAAVITQNFPMAETTLNILYVTVMAVLFTCIAAPPAGLYGRFSGVTRLLAGSSAGAVLLAVIFFRMISSPAFPEYADYVMSLLNSLYTSSSSDVVENARMEMLTVESILDALKAILLRGGALVSCTVLFAVSRQAGFSLARIGRRVRAAGAGTNSSSSAGPASAAGTGSPDALIAFHVRPQVIWVFSVSLMLVVLTRAAKLEIPEIILWNVLMLCAMLYFAQGLGIVQFFLARPGTPPFMRMFLVVLFVLLLFSPVLNAFLLGGLVLLGTAENWVPFRVPKQNSPPSTPEAGDDDYF